MLTHHKFSVNFILVAGALLSGCTTTRQIVIDHPTIQATQFQPLHGFQVIDGDDYYVRLISEFDFKGDNVLKSGCSNIGPSYEKGDLSAAIIYSVRNEVLKFSREATGFLYQATTGKCNFTFDAKKLYLTPWIRLDSGKETVVDYNFYTNANSDVDVSGLVGDVNAASNLLALTGVGMGAAIVGQVTGQWVKNNQQFAPTSPATHQSAKHSSESHSLPALTAFTGNVGTLNQTIFKVYDVAEGGINVFSSDAKSLGELKIYPEILSSLLLKTMADGIPDARDSSFEEISYAPIKSASGEINLQQMLEQSKLPEKPNLKPDWNNYLEVESNCRKLKLEMKNLGFNKFDRDAVLYYYLAKNPDWHNYNIDRQKMLTDEMRPKVIDSYRNKNFAGCLAVDDYSVMKTMGLSVNTALDWEQFGDASQKKEQLYSPLKSIERQLLAVLKNTNVTEMESQLYPLLNTTKNGEGTVLLQNHLGDFGLEALLNPPVLPVVVDAKASPEVPVALVPATTVIPGEGVIVTARQLAQVASGLSISELSCVRPVPDGNGKYAGNSGLLLFARKEGARVKGGGMEFEFSGGKITRIAFQLSTYRDFEQDLLDRPELGGCRVDPTLVIKLH
ncbi:MAG: hypothetical protein NTX38_13395 [Methylobacter sp.]|nr:hypothetical protein [Methylobacter sp.]